MPRRIGDADGGGVIAPRSASTERRIGRSAGPCGDIWLAHQFDHRAYQSDLGANVILVIRDKSPKWEPTLIVLAPKSSGASDQLLPLLQLAERSGISDLAGERARLKKTKVHRRL